MTPLANPAISGELWTPVPKTREGLALVISAAMPRAILAGSERYPPMAQPTVSTMVRFTWWTTLGSRSW